MKPTEVQKKGLQDKPKLPIQALIRHWSVLLLFSNSRGRINRRKNPGKPFLKKEWKAQAREKQRYPEKPTPKRRRWLQRD